MDVWMNKGVISVDLIFIEVVKEWVVCYFFFDKKIILDYDDGVGLFFKLGDCLFVVNYKLIFVDKDVDLLDFDVYFLFNFGDVYYKGFDVL